MKKTLTKPMSLILSILLVVSILPISAISVFAEANADFQYESSSGKVTITKYVGTNEDVVIPSQLDGNAVTKIDYHAFDNCDNIKSVKVPETVTDLGSNFSSCKNLESIIVDSANTIYRSVDGILYKKDLSELLICPLGKTGVVTVADGTIKLDRGSFWNCANVTDVVLPDSVKSFDFDVFYQCTALKTVTLGKYFIVSNNSNFEGCTNFTKFILTADNDNYKCIDGVLYSNDCKTLLMCPTGISGKFTVNNDVTTIAKCAFYACSLITEIEVPENVTSIEQQAFNKCSGLTEITLPETISTINFATFCGCTNLKEIEIPFSVTKIDYESFIDCPNLEGIAILNNECELVNGFINNKNTVLYGFVGSTAEKYAEDNEFNFGLVILPGDVNLDGNYKLMDAKVIMMYIADAVELTDAQKQAADVNRDGNVTIYDVRVLMQVLADLPE